MPIDPLTGGAIISGASSIFSNLIGNAGSKRAQERANRHNIAFWKMQNQYNHPVEQMARLKSAGLNPNLIYGGSPSSATGNADKIAPSKAAEFKFDNPLQDINQFANLEQINATTDNLREQNKVIIQDAILKGMQSLKTQAEGQSAQTKAKLDNALFDTSLDIQKENLRRLKQQIVGQDLDNLLKDSTLKTKVEQEVTRLSLIKQELTNSELLGELRKLENELKAQGLENANPIMKWIYRHLGNFGENLDYFKDLKDGKIKPRIIKD